MERPCAGAATRGHGLRRVGRFRRSDQHLSVATWPAQRPRWNPLSRTWPAQRAPPNALGETWPEARAQRNVLATNLPSVRKGGPTGAYVMPTPAAADERGMAGGANHDGLVRRAQSLSSCRMCISAVESERMKTLVIPFSAGRPPCVRLNVPNPSSGQKNVEFVGSIRLATTFFKRYQSSARSPVRSSTPDCRAPRSADRPVRAGQQWPTSRRTLANR